MYELQSSKDEIRMKMFEINFFGSLDSVINYNCCKPVHHICFMVRCMLSKYFISNIMDMTLCELFASNTVPNWDSGVCSKNIIIIIINKF